MSSKLDATVLQEHRSSVDGDSKNFPIWHVTVKEEPTEFTPLSIGDEVPSENTIDHIQVQPTATVKIEGSTESLDLNGKTIKIEDIIVISDDSEDTNTDKKILYRCCKEKFEDKKSFDNHMLSHQRIRCKICSKNVTRLGLNNHIQDLHSKPCRYCAKRFRNTFFLKRHIEVLHPQYFNGWDNNDYIRSRPYPYNYDMQRESMTSYDNMQSQFRPNDSYMQSQRIPNYGYIQSRSMSNDCYIQSRSMPNDCYMQSQFVSNDRYMQSQQMQHYSYVQSQSLPNDWYMQSQCMRNYSYIQSQPMERYENMQSYSISSTDSLLNRNNYVKWTRNSMRNRSSQKRSNFGKVKSKPKNIKQEPKPNIKTEPISTYPKIKIEPGANIKIEPGASIEIEPWITIKIEPGICNAVTEPLLRNIKIEPSY